jgi:hypothetical protein
MVRVLEVFMKNQSHRRGCPFPRLHVEVLEGRIVLSAFTVDRLTDMGQGSGLAGDLRYCLTQATGQDTIEFGVTGTINLSQALPDVSSSITLDGPGVNVLTVQRNSGGSYRIFKVDAGATVAISGLTIADGLASIQGGGIDNLGTLALSNCVLTANHAGSDQGGGVYNGPGAVLTLNNCTLSANQVDDASGSGGGIFNAGMLTISQCTVAGNFAAEGAGIYNSAAGIVNISGSTISNNSGASDGGGISNAAGAVTLTNSTLSGNSAIDNGGGIRSSGTLVVSNCTFTANTNSDAYGSALNASGSASISNSTISGNVSQSGYGAILLGSQDTMLSDCIISGNTTSQSGTIIGGAAISGCTISGNTVTGADSAGGIIDAGTISDCTISGNTGWVGGIINARTISNCTISGNLGDAPPSFPTAGGIAALAAPASDVVIAVLSCTIADNTVANKVHTASQLYSGQVGTGTGDAIIQLHDAIIAGDGSVPNFLADVGGSFSSQGYNLSSDGGAGFLTGPGDLINANPLLGPLQNNGGPTPTMALLPGSPAVDAGDNTGAPDFDQRGSGFPRIVGGVIDIGALEVQLGPAKYFQLGAPAQVTSDTPFDVTLTALDAYGHMAAGYLGTVTFSTSDPASGVVLPPNYAFMAADNGLHLFSGGLTLSTPGSQTVTVADTLVPTINGSLTVAVSPPIFVVNTTADSGPGSLRQAILNADAAPGPSSIQFAVNSGVQTIELASPLPAITEPVVIDGTSQPGYAGVPLIELDGAGAGPQADGLLITAGDSVVEGLVINRFTLAGIELRSNGGDILEGNYIGTDVTGSMALGNSIGVSVSSANNTIGGTATGAGNVISGNLGDGILFSAGATGNVVQDNLIGTDATATVSLGNGQNGVHLLSASGNAIGGTGSGAANVIAFNGNDGVLVDTGMGNSIRQNIIYGHDNGLGIELINGGNNDLPFPVLTVVTSDGVSTSISGLLVSTPNTALTLEFFANSTSNPSGFGEGEQLLGTGAVTTNSHGAASFTMTFAVAVPLGELIAATATDPANDTSEFSNCVGVVSGPGIPPPLPPAPSGPSRNDSPVGTSTAPNDDASPSLAGAGKVRVRDRLGSVTAPHWQRATDILFRTWHLRDRQSANTTLSSFLEESLGTNGVIRN